MSAEFDARKTDYTNNSDAAAELQTLITNFVRKITFSSGLGVNKNDIINAINKRIDANNFHTHNRDDKIVEVHATFTARKDGHEVFILEVIWDADNPPAGSTQTAHYGWEIKLDRKMKYGPGHVFFKRGVELPNSRPAKLLEYEATRFQLNETISSDLGGTLECVTRYYTHNSYDNKEIDEQKKKEAQDKLNKDKEMKKRTDQKEENKKNKRT
ncbi:hypothetical protein TARUN_7498 [Trichoderma arundinaceum]|uniref:Uncharacterized protein n=1 Tax=Trichoderma arundinaceum TaxID=490622 RepID=A0A395NF58_TRIAR|nr:hypothetical protein TARUN_7498 [Trichoderma arundinaceum]